MPNIKLSSLSLNKTDASLMSSKASSIMRSTESLNKATEKGQEWEDDWRLYKTTLKHTEHMLNRKIAERAAEVCAREERRREELRQAEQLERARLQRRLNAYSASRHKRAQQLAEDALEKQRLMRQSSTEREQAKLTRTLSRFGANDSQMRSFTARQHAVDTRADAAKHAREQSFRDRNAEWQQRHLTSIRLREEMRQQDDARVEAIRERQGARFAVHEAALGKKAAQVSARANDDAQRRARQRDFTQSMHASADVERRERNMLASTNSLARLQDEQEHKMQALREAKAERERALRINLEARERDAAEREARLRSLAAATATRANDIDAKRRLEEAEVQGRVRKGVQTRAALYDVEHKSQVTHRDPAEVRQLMNQLPGGFFLTG